MLGPKGDVSETSTWSSHLACDVSSYVTGRGPTVEFTQTSCSVSPSYVYRDQGHSHRQAHRPSGPLEADFGQVAHVTWSLCDPTLTGGHDEGVGQC